jgi:15-cis-phytoene synthase
MVDDEQIFKNGSTTYYWSSKFFPGSLRKDIFKLYSFVRVADDFVDAVPQNKKEFEHLAEVWAKLCKGKKIHSKKGNIINHVAQNMYDVAIKYDFDMKWVDAFLGSMRMDIQAKKYKTMEDTLSYIYGSAEVIGLMMSKIIGVNPEAYEYAKLQGRAMQYINFIRDIDEDIDLGRCYFPQSELSKYGLAKLDYKTIQNHPGAYREFIEGQILHYNQWQAEANKGLHAIPYRQRIAVRTAVDMYNWTSRKIADDPMIVFEKKVKPSKFRVIARATTRLLNA